MSTNAFPEIHSSQSGRLPATELFTHGARRALDYLGLWTQHSGARVVHIESTDLGVVRQCLLHLPYLVEAVSVPSSDLLGDEAWPWPISTGSIEAEVALYPFSLEVGACEPTAPGVIGCFRNTFSYRKLFYPRQPSLTMRQVRGMLKRRGYAIKRVAGICPPHFIFWWTLGMIAGPRLSSWHFQFTNHALQHLLKGKGWSRYSSYLVVFYARRQNLK